MNLVPWLARAGRHVRARALFAALFGVVGLWAAVRAPAPPAHEPKGIAAMLGAAAGGEVSADDFIWEAKGGFWSDSVVGRHVLFLSKREGAAADLYRARVRLTREGRPMALYAVRDLTESPLGEEHDLIARGHHAAFVTTAFGAVQAVTVLELDGEPSGPSGTARWLERAGTALDRWLSTGDSRGLARTEITFANPPAEVKHELDGDLLVLSLGKDGVPAALDLKTMTLDTGASNPYGAAAQRIPARSRPLSVSAVEAAGSLVGPRAASFLRGALSVLGPRAVAVAPKRGKTMPAGAAAPEGDWPPPRITPAVTPPLEGEGLWVAGRAPPASPGAPAPLFETGLRPDPKKPDVLVRLVALDTRQLDLRLQAGFDEPRSATGLHGTGGPPSGVAPERVALAFASGPSGTHEAPGFVIGRRTLVEPQKGAGTLALGADGRALLGAWPFGAEVPPTFTAVKQTGDGLVGWSGGPVAPLDDPGDAIERSAIGLLPTGQLVVAWGSPVTAATLGRALELAGCTQALPLAARAAGFAYPKAGGPGGTSAWDPAAPEMSFPGPEMATGGPSPVDVLYAVTRGPDAPPGWEVDPGRQPTPAWLPGVRSRVFTTLGAQVRVTTFAAGRALFRLRIGSKEPITKSSSALPSGLPAGEEARVLAAIGVGVGRKKGAYGLAIDGAVGFPFRSEGGVLILDHGRPRIVPAAGFTASPGEDAVELPLTADGGQQLPAARVVTTMRARAAACALDDGAFAIATTSFDTDEATTTALLELGCSRVVSLDRGAHHLAFLHRAGTGNPPEAHYESSVLFAIDTPLSGRAGPLASP